MNWDQFEAELRAEHNAAQSKLAFFLAIRRAVSELRRIGADQRRQLQKQAQYIIELEKELEPEVTQEIRDELEHNERQSL